MPTVKHNTTNVFIDITTAIHNIINVITDMLTVKSIH